jgi:hypothetical protein
MSDKPLRDVLPPELRDGLEAIQSFAAPSDPTGFGFMAVDDGEARIRAGVNLEFDRLPLEGLAASSLLRWAHAPSVFVFEGTDPPEVLLGTPRTAEAGGETAPEYDSARERFVLRFRTDDADVFADLRNGEVALWRRDSGGSPRFEDLPLRSPARLALTAPDLDALVPAALPSWLTTRCRSVLGVRDDGPAEAVGLVLRLGQPESVEARREELDRLQSGRTGRRERWADDWLAAQDGGEVKRLERLARHHAGALFDFLEGLPATLSHDPAAARSAAEDIVLGCDRAASMAALLARAGLSGDLQRLLTQLDRGCVVAGAAFGDALRGSDVLDSDWLEAVSWQEPDAWWGTLEGLDS